MKNLLLMTGCLLLTSCSLHERGYHTVQVAKKRSEALDMNQLRTGVVVSHVRPPNQPLPHVRGVIVRSEFNGEITWAFKDSPEGQQATAESIFIRTLTAKGYQAVSRHNLAPVQHEKAFPTGRISTQQSLFKPSHRLVLSVNRWSVGPENYEWSEDMEGRDFKWKIGTRATINVTVTLIDERTSDTLWMSQILLGRVLNGPVSQAALFSELIQILAETIPVQSTSHENSK